VGASAREYGKVYDAVRQMRAAAGAGVIAESKKGTHAC